MSEENYGFRVIHRSTLNNFIASQAKIAFIMAISPLKIKVCSLTGLSYNSYLPPDISYDFPN